MENDDFDAAVARLGCGHEITHVIADHPLLSIEDIYGVEIGDELDCPFCPVSARP